MSVGIPETTLIFRIETIIVLIATFHNIILFCYHLCRLCIDKFNHDKKICKMHKISLCTLLLIVFYNINTSIWKFANIILAKQSIYFDDFHHCQWILYVGISWLFLAKTSNYILFLERLFTIFAGRGFGFKRTHIIFTRCYYILSLLGSISVTYLFVKSSINPHDSWSCAAMPPLWLIIYWTFIDIQLTLVVSILFARKLFIINISDSDENILNLLRKCTFLALVSLLSTQISGALSEIFGAVTLWLHIDSIINSWCIMLLFSVHKHIYSNMCRHTEKCITSKFLQCYSCIICCPISKDSNTYDSEQADTIDLAVFPEPTTMKRPALNPYLISDHCFEPKRESIKQNDSCSNTQNESSSTSDNKNKIEKNLSFEFEINSDTTNVHETDVK